MGELWQVLLLFALLGLLIWRLAWAEDRRKEKLSEEEQLIQREDDAW